MGGPRRDPVRERARQAQGCVLGFGGDTAAGRPARLTVLAGGCLCAGVRYELADAPISASYCHCKHCQRRTGTAVSAQARIHPGSLHILRGAELLTSFEPPGGWVKI